MYKYINTENERKWGSLHQGTCETSKIKEVNPIQLGLFHTKKLNNLWKFIQKSPPQKKKLKLINTVCLKASS
jgi:hypothetical protein